MKTVLLLLLAMLAVETTGAFNMSRAQAQDACSKSYISCVDKCVVRPSKTLQDNCMEACQTQNNACYSQSLGAPGPTAVTVKEEPAQDDRAVAAEDEQRPDAKPVQTAKPAKTAKPAAKPERRAQ